MTVNGASLPCWIRCSQNTSASSATCLVSAHELLLRCQTPEDMLDISTEELTALLNKGPAGAASAGKRQRRSGIRCRHHLWHHICQRALPSRSNSSWSNSALPSSSWRFGSADCGYSAVNQSGHCHHSRHRRNLRCGHSVRDRRYPCFETPAKLVAYAGLDVRVNQSGEFTGSRTNYLNGVLLLTCRAIWLAATRAAFCDPTLSAYYQSLRGRGNTT